MDATRTTYRGYPIRDDRGQKFIEVGDAKAEELRDTDRNVSYVDWSCKADPRPTRVYLNI
jgi:hypothetical protein